MRREKLWEEALAKVREAAAKTQTGDRLALLVFDSSTEVLLGFDTAEEEGASGGDLVASRLEGLEAGWGWTDLGSAIAFAAELVEEARTRRTLSADRRPVQRLGCDRAVVEQELKVDRPAVRQNGESAKLAHVSHAVADDVGNPQVVDRCAD